jgi:hypothetical protein
LRPSSKPLSRRFTSLHVVIFPGKGAAILKGTRNGTEALRLAQSAIALSSPNNYVTADVLAAALAETGAFDQALKVLDTAITSAGDSTRLEAMKQHRAAYTQKQPWHE